MNQELKDAIKNVFLTMAESFKSQAGLPIPKDTEVTPVMVMLRRCGDHFHGVLDIPMGPFFTSKNAKALAAELQKRLVDEGEADASCIIAEAWMARGDKERDMKVAMTVGVENLEGAREVLLFNFYTPEGSAIGFIEFERNAEGEIVDLTIDDKLVYSGEGETHMEGTMVPRGANGGGTGTVH
jgi:hypothetical protein